MQAAAIPLVTVDNPAEYAERVVNPKVTVLRSLRDDPLGNMDDRRQIKAHQYTAGRQFQAAYEAAGIGRIRTMDPTSEPVDGSRKPASGFSEPQRVAFALLRRWEALLGRPGYRLISAVLIEKMALREAARAFYGQASEANNKYVGRLFRECLDQLAEDMGLMT